MKSSQSVNPLADSMSFQNYLRFSLRRLLGVVALLAIIVSWLGRGAYYQRLAISKLGMVSCTYDFERNPRVTFSLFPNANSPQADFIRSIIGNNVFGNVVEIQIDNSYSNSPNNHESVNQKYDFSYFAYLPKLETLYLIHPTLADDDLTNLKFATKLKNITIFPSAVLMKDNATIPSDWITEKSFDIFCNLKNLENITLITKACSNESILRLSCLERLKTVQIFRPPPKYAEPDYELIKQFHEKMPQMNLQDILIH